MNIDNNTNNTSLNIQQLIKQAHNNAVEKGFYDLCDCDEGYGYNCSLCNNKTGVIQNKNIGELLMLIVSELGEALEAHRNNNRCKPEWIEAFLTVFKESSIGDKFGFFKGYIKDTFEDEIADVFIRLFDLCGYLGYEGSGKSPIYCNWTTQKEWTNNVGDNLRRICKIILDVDLDYIGPSYFSVCFSYLNYFCNFHNIPIQKHITAKMQYNKTRPHKHGKEY